MSVCVGLHVCLQNMDVAECATEIHVPKYHNFESVIHVEASSR